MNKHLFLYPELLSRLIFTRMPEGKFLVQATPNQQPRSANPEEIIRQIFVLSLIHHYHYPEERIKIEQSVLMGRDRKRADVVVTGDGDGLELVVEVKLDIDRDAIDQLRSYLMATGAPVGAVVSGHELRCFTRAGNQLTEINDLPMYGERPADSINAPAPWNTPIPTTNSSASLDPIERFERINQASTGITIGGRTHTFSNKDLANLEKVQQRFIVDGVVFGANIRKPDWHAIIGSQFASALASSNTPTFATGSVVPLALIERFERVNRTNTSITIKGRTHRFSNKDLFDLKKVQRRYIADGIVFGANIRKPDWLATIESQFSSAPLAVSNEAHEMTDPVEKAVLNVCDWTPGANVDWQWMTATEVWQRINGSKGLPTRSESTRVGEVIIRYKNDKTYKRSNGRTLHLIPVKRPPSDFDAPEVPI